MIIIIWNIERGPSKRGLSHTIYDISDGSLLELGFIAHLKPAQWLYS